MSGLLPLADIPSLATGRPGGKPGTSFVRCQLQVATGGQAKIVVNSTDGLSLWLNGTPLEIRPETLLELSPGTQTLTFAVDRTRRSDGLRCELLDVPGSPAQLQIVGGK